MIQTYNQLLIMAQSVCIIKQVEKDDYRCFEVTKQITINTNELRLMFAILFLFFCCSKNEFGLFTVRCNKVNMKNIVISFHRQTGDIFVVILLSPRKHDSISTNVNWGQNPRKKRVETTVIILTYFVILRLFCRMVGTKQAAVSLEKLKMAYKARIRQSYALPKRDGESVPCNCINVFEHDCNCDRVSQ